jgi:hypothetical protein
MAVRDSAPTAGGVGGTLTASHAPWPLARYLVLSTRQVVSF